jgi:hypothetical protein
MIYLIFKASDHAGKSRHCSCPNRERIKHKQTKISQISFQCMYKPHLVPIFGQSIYYFDLYPGLKSETDSTSHVTIIS